MIYFSAVPCDICGYSAKYTCDLCGRAVCNDHAFYNDSAPHGTICAYGVVDYGYCWDVL